MVSSLWVATEQFDTSIPEELSKLQEANNR
jgi:hypothetical protein